MKEDKQKQNINILVSLLVGIIGIANLVLWYNKILSIYGLVFGIFWLIVAAFVFHFRHKK